MIRAVIGTSSVPRHGLIPYLEVLRGICLLASPFTRWLLLKDSEAAEETRFKIQ